MILSLSFILEILKYETLKYLIFHCNILAMKGKKILPASCLLVDIVSFGRLFM